ncbi:MAG TPA: lyase family protein [Bacteroidales bacterium]|nr:lyase family protein [Bacteroidales bacterium]
MRKEKDFLGEMQIPANALYGIHAARAVANFKNDSTFPVEWYKSVGAVKLACYKTCEKFFELSLEKFGKNLPLTIIESNVLDALKVAATEVSLGKWFEYFIVPAVQGGAGTSINMNINEIIANRALQITGHNPGEYQFIHPVEHANIYQSTNDVIPTAMRLAVIQLLTELEEEVNKLRLLMEETEQRFRNIPRIAYTQMQQAVPTTYGKLFSTYCDALARDWWRISKCFERIKTVNLGGSAVGTSITVPRYFVMEAVRTLQKNTGLPLTRGENLCDATANNDALVEVHAILKSHAVNIEKFASDLRLLAADISNENLSIPQKQVGSSIMPGKINPVIPEFLISIAHRVYANDQMIASLCAQGCLELNAYLPSIGNAMIESLKLLIAADISFRENLLTGINADAGKSEEIYLKSPALSTALLPYIGYEKASEVASYMQQHRCTIFEANKALGFIEEQKLHEALHPDKLLKQGFLIKDLL